MARARLAGISHTKVAFLLLANRYLVHLDVCVESLCLWSFLLRRTEGELDVIRAVNQQKAPIADQDSSGSLLWEKNCKSVDGIPTHTSRTKLWELFGLLVSGSRTLQHEVCSSWDPASNPLGAPGAQRPLMLHSPWKVQSVILSFRKGVAIGSCLKLSEAI